AAYEPMYFLVGTDPEDSKFQVSLQHRFFDNKGTLAQKYPWVNALAESLLNYRERTEALRLGFAIVR
ncbi:MAG: hypothetical protein WBI57_06905, partial [Desulfobacterales bacterium]